MNGTLELIVKRGELPSEWESFGLPVTGLDPSMAPMFAGVVWAATAIVPIAEPNPLAVAQWTCVSSDFFDSLLSYWPETEVRTVPTQEGAE